MFTLPIAIYGFVVASIGTLGPLLTTALFGNKEYSEIYASAVVGLAVAGIVALPGYGYIYEFAGSLYIRTLGDRYHVNHQFSIDYPCIQREKELRDFGHWN